MSRKIGIIALCLCTVFVFGFLNFGKKKDAVAIVGKDVISQQDLNDRIASFPQQYAQAFQQKENKVRVLDQLIDEQVMLTAAEKKGYTSSESFNKQLDAARRQLALRLFIADNVDSKIQVTEQDLQAYYQRNNARFAAVERRKASHILVKTKKEADRVLARLKKGAKFASIAKKQSLDPGTKDNGGDLGWFQKGQLVPPFEKAVYGLKRKGQLSRVVKTQFGYHVIRLDGVDKRPAIKYDQVRPQIQQAVVAEKKQALTQQLLADLKKEVKVTRQLDNVK